MSPNGYDKKLTICMQVNFACFFVFCCFFQNQLFQKIISRIPTKESNSLDPGQARHFVGPDLDPICLQRLSEEEENTSR